MSSSQPGSTTSPLELLVSPLLIPVLVLSPTPVLPVTPPVVTPELVLPPVLVLTVSPPFPVDELPAPLVGVAPVVEADAPLACVVDPAPVLLASLVLVLAAGPQPSSPSATHNDSLTGSIDACRMAATIHHVGPTPKNQQ